jgi:hypothetical protein
MEDLLWVRGVESYGFVTVVVLSLSSSSYMFLTFTCAPSIFFFISLSAVPFSNMLFWLFRHLLLTRYLASGCTVWTNPLPFWDIPSRDTKLLEELRAADLVIFKVIFRSLVFSVRLKGSTNHTFLMEPGRFELSEVNGRCSVGNRDSDRRSHRPIKRTVQPAIA